MKSIIKLSAVLLVLFALGHAAVAAAAEEAASTPALTAENLQAFPTLTETPLYKERVHACHFVDLSTWTHPTKAVLAKHGVPLSSLELCNENKYPIFHVKFKYDPFGDTNSFFNPFYAAMFVANGRNPMAFIDSMDNEIVYIEKDNGDGLGINYGQYTP